MAADSSARLEHLRLRDLLLIERVHDLGSLRKVAESLHLTQPAVTQALQTLEDCFGTQLVQRSSGGAVLTEAGSAVLRRLRPLRAEAQAALEQARRPRQPTIRLGLNQVAVLDLASPALATFVEQQPEVRIELREGNSPELWRLLAAGEIDAVVGRMPGAAAFAQVGDGIECTVLGAERMAVVAAARHPLLRDGVDRELLARQRWVLPPPQSRARSALDEWFLQVGLATPLVSVASESIQLNLRLVAASTMLTVVSRLVVDELGPAFGLAVLPLDVAWEGFSYAFGCRRSSLPDPLLEALRDHFVRRGWPGRSD